MSRHRGGVPSPGWSGPAAGLSTQYWPDAYEDHSSADEKEDPMYGNTVEAEQFRENELLKVLQGLVTAVGSSGNVPMACLEPYIAARRVLSRYTEDWQGTPLNEQNERQTTLSAAERELDNWRQLAEERGSIIVKLSQELSEVVARNTGGTHSAEWDGP